VTTTHADLVWRVAATEAPLVVKDCAKCSGRSRFVCSEKFRVNAQQRSIDVWLIYRCTECESTWNCRLIRRASPTSIEPALYSKFQSNDRDAARSYAFDLALLKRNGVKVEYRGDVLLEGPDLEHDAAGTARVLVSCELDGRWRLDKLLAAKLGISRSRLERLFAEGGIEFEPPVRRLGAPLGERTTLVVRLDKLPKSSHE
jgi:hypothetical protein